MTPQHAIEIEGLRKSFGAHAVLGDVTLAVPAGSTFAFLGRNGQGKTTTIRILLGLLAADAGRVSVGGFDPARDSLRLRANVGYLAEDQRMFGWMTVAQTLGFVRPFYPAWDAAFAGQLLKDFGLDPAARVGDLSKGLNVRLGLLLALAHRPATVILDDPTLGLDPIMRREFMRDVIDHLQGNGVTVFFSSHLLYEIEPVADEIAILDGGRIVRHAPTETLREDVCQFVLAAEDFERIGSLPNVLDVKPAERRIAVVTENARTVREQFMRAGFAFDDVGLNLDEIFEAYVTGNRGARNA